MNERFVAVSTVTGSRICGCFSKPRCDFSVTREWQQIINAMLIMNVNFCCYLYRQYFIIKLTTPHFNSC